MVELLFLCTLSRGMKDVFILPRGLGLRGVEQKIKNVTFLNPLIYLVYYGFPYTSSPVFVNFVQDSVQILVCQEGDTLSVRFMIQLILEFQNVTLDFVFSQLVSRHTKKPCPVYRTEYSVILMVRKLVSAFHHLVHCHHHQYHQSRMLPRR